MASDLSPAVKQAAAKVRARIEDLKEEIESEEDKKEKAMQAIYHAPHHMAVAINDGDVKAVVLAASKINGAQKVIKAAQDKIETALASLQKESLMLAKLMGA